MLSPANQHLLLPRVLTALRDFCAGGCVWPGAAPRRALGVGPGAGCVPVGALPALSGVCGGPAARQRRGAGRGAHGGGLVGVGGARHGGGAVDHLGGGRDVARGAALPPSVRLRGAAHLHLRRAARRCVSPRCGAEERAAPVASPVGGWVGCPISWFARAGDPEARASCLVADTSGRLAPWEVENSFSKFS